MQDSQHFPGQSAAPQAATPQPTPQQAAELERFDDEARADIYRRAAQIQADTLFRDDDRWTKDELAAGARGAGISDAALQSAIEEREKALAEQVANAKIEAAQRAQQRKKFAIGGAIAAGIVGLSLLTTQAKLSGAYAQVESARAQVDNTLQRRHDLVPNLIGVTKEQLANQRQLIAQLEAANQAAKNAQGDDKTAAEADLTAAIAQATSKLQTDAGDSPVAIRLIDEMAGAENRIAQTRRQYNNAAAQYNQKARGFPTTFLRPFLGYKSRVEPLQADVAAQQAPKF